MQDAQHDLSACQLGQPGERLDLRTASAINQVAGHMLSQCKRSFYILAPTWEECLFERDNITTGLYELARYSRNSDIRILLHSSDEAVRNNCRIVDLARRLSSYIDVRIQNKSFQSCSEAFMLADKRGVIYQGLSSRYDALADYHSPRLCESLTSNFLEMWAHSHRDPNFRQLHI